MGTRVLIVDDSKLARIVLGKTISALSRIGRASKRQMRTRP